MTYGIMSDFIDDLNINEIWHNPIYGVSYAQLEL